MHTRFVFFCFVQLFLLAGCKDHQQQQKTDAANNKAEPFYPFPQYFEGELAYIDSMPLVVEYSKTIDGKKYDSIYLDKAEFKRTVEEWISEDPNEKIMHDEFKESSFQDLTLNTVTFSISATGAKTRLRQADILLNPDTKKVQHIALKRSWNAGDSSVLQSILWVHHMRCLVSEEINYNDKPMRKLTHSYVWDRPL